MRILLLSKTKDQEKGGGPYRWASELVKVLPQNGKKIRNFRINHKQIFSKRLFIGMKEVRKSDIIQIYVSNLGILFLAFYSRLIGKKIIYTCRGDFFKEWKDRGVWLLIKYYLLAKVANYLVFPSKYMRDKITKKIEKENKVIYGPYNIEELRKMRFKKKRKNGKYIFLAVTSFKYSKKAKGMLLLKNTFKKFKKIYPKSKIIVIGSGKHLENIKNKTNEKDIEFLGKQNRDEVYKNMRDCDCFIHITDLDNLPLSIVEAAAFGKQIIASNKFGIPEISKKILLVDNSSKNILDKMLEAYEKNEKIVRHDILKFSSKKMGENFAKLYDKIYKSKN